VTRPSSRSRSKVTPAYPEWFLRAKLKKSAQCKKRLQYMAMRPWPSTFQAEIIPNTDLQSSYIEATFRLSVEGLLRHRDPQSDLPKERVMGRKELVDELFEKANGDRHVFEESLREAGIPFVDADSEESQAFIAKYVTYDLYGAGTGVLVAIE
jgi:hypothetical protein